jgi:hypothetical protein
LHQELAYLETSARRPTEAPGLTGFRILVTVVPKILNHGFTFLVVTAPLTRARRWLELPLFVFAGVTLCIDRATRFNDDKFMQLSVASIVFAAGVTLAFVRGRARR